MKKQRVSLVFMKIKISYFHIDNDIFRIITIFGYK